MFIQNPEMPMQSQTELRRAAIDQELETRTHKAKDRRVQETGSDDGWQQIVFNNFFQRLPLSSLEAHSRRKGEENLEAMGIPWWNQSNRENYAGDTTGKSEKFFDKTPAQFYANADSVFNATVKAQGLNTDELDALAAEGKTNILHDRLVPVYVALRLEGYNHADLTT